MNNGSVEAWSTKRLPPEPRGEFRSMRDEIGKAVAELECGPEQVLHGTYMSSVSERQPIDTENTLFYNVPTNCFAKSARVGIKFERVFAAPPLAPHPMGSRALHYQSYRLLNRRAAFSSWSLANVAASFSGVRCRSTSVEAVWEAMRGDRELAVATGSLGSYFGLSVTVRPPAGTAPLNLVNLLKPVFDGVVSSFHQHDGTDDAELGRRVAGSLESEPERVSQLLVDGSQAVLGSRRLLWRRGDGVQWGPADDRCVAGELLLGEVSEGGFYELSGKLTAAIATS